MFVHVCVFVCVHTVNLSLLCPAVTAEALVLSLLIVASHPQRSQCVSVSVPHGGQWGIITIWL